jgi:hypothetical protein
VKHIKQQIEEARRQVGICRQRAESPRATVEDELKLANARAWLLTLENRVLRRIAALQKKLGKGQMPQQPARPTRLTGRARAEAAFAQVQKGGS